MPRWLRQVAGSLAGKLIVLAAIFLVVPIMLYSRFQAADEGRQEFLLRTLQVQGKLAAAALEPSLARLDPQSLLAAQKAVANLAEGRIRVRLLLKPMGRDAAFFLVAVNPAIDPDNIAAERDRLDRTGILAHLDESCAGDQPLDMHYVGASGQDELLTSLTPIHSAAGCWVLITGYAADDLAATSLARNFSQAPEVRLATAFYGLMAILLVMTVIGTVLDLKRFAKIARRIRLGDRAEGTSFAGVTGVPELAPVAREFDHMVATLDASARSMREAAEDNAHSLKTPIGAIMQSLEPLRHAIKGDIRASQALGAIEQAVVRLSSLVDATRRIDVAAAELMKAKLQSVDVAALAVKMAEAYSRTHQDDGIRVEAASPGPAFVAATEDSLETVIENLLDNAVGFSPKGGIVSVKVIPQTSTVTLTVDDQGPGVAPDQLAQIFQRNFSYRPNQPAGDDRLAHFGVGLAVVRRNIELLGGTVSAANIEGAGLRVTVVLRKV